ncbi:Roq1p DI49_2881 [Saccharomyces eubayanus]|uniref:Roq1p n=1 Tax=Saccharomyces eubayanus TaxID=1080349 RepID=UPI0006C15A26|nr:hypothetical protein DI49_2881 [Saccharomyces eubayanus]KOG98474.1 hypothetical protein DI49_2881 [Saccharomyces eubayanus]
MLRKSTSTIYTTHKKSNSSILRSRKDQTKVDPLVEEYPMGDFGTTNQPAQPSVIYYFVELTNAGIQENTSSNNNNNNNNNNNHDGGESGARYGHGSSLGGNVHLRRYS